MADRQIPIAAIRTGAIASCMAALLAACALAASAGDSADTTQAAPAGGKILKGDVHDAGTLMPSATLTPGTDQTQAPAVQQYAGSAQDKLHPRVQPPTPGKKPGDGPGKGVDGKNKRSEDGQIIGNPSTPPPPKLWGTASDDERPVRIPPAWGQETPVHLPAAPPQPSGSALLAPKKPTAVTPPNGVMTWQPGHAVKQIKPLTVGPMQLTTSELQAILMHKRSLMPDIPRTGNISPRSSGPQPLSAKQMVLPHHIAANWSEWYQNVAHAIYQVWQQEQVCPGSATVRTTVFAGQDVDCRIFEFKPATDLKRNAAAESLFRDAAKKSVNSIDKSAVCQFPADQHPKKVVFDIELTRLVDGPAGCAVVHTHQNPAMRASQR